MVKSDYTQPVGNALGFVGAMEAITARMQKGLTLASTELPNSIALLLSNLKMYATRDDLGVAKKLASYARIIASIVAAGGYLPENNGSTPNKPRPVIKPAYGGLTSELNPSLALSADFGSNGFPFIRAEVFSVIRQSHHLVAHILQILAGGGLGLFAAALAHMFGTRSSDRMPGESRWPHCFYCMKPLSWQESFPLIGWLLRPDVLAMPCPCGKRTGLWAQPMAEIIGFMLGIIGMYLVDWSWEAIPLCLGLGLMAAIAFVDLQFGLIPDGMNVLLAGLGVLWLWASGGDFYMAFAVAGVLLALGLFCALVYSKWRGREMLGLGDVKFFAAAGLWLPVMTAPWFLVLAGIFGVVLSVLWRRGGGGKEFPFAPALCLALAVCVLVPLARQLMMYL